jgi:hypothetical protein
VPDSTSKQDSLLSQEYAWVRGTRAAQGLSSLELANSLDLELDKQQSLLITSIRELGSGFQSTTVLLNNVLHTVGQDSSPLVTHRGGSFSWPLFWNLSL